MEPKTIFLILFILILIYFRFGPGSRLLKKKSHHYIVPPASEKDRNWIPVEMEEYAKFIYIQEYWTEKQINERLNDFKEEGLITDFDIKLKDGWFCVELKEVTFNDFHFLIHLFSVVSDKMACGFCQHQEFPEKDYIVKKDESDMDYLLGVFRTNVNFGIYIPKLNTHPKGNISKSPVFEIDFDFEIGKFQISDQNR